jgi:hypothetical protein
MFKRKVRVVTISLNKEGAACYIPQEKVLWRWRNCTVRGFDKVSGVRVSLPVIFDKYQDAVDFLFAKDEG